MKTQMSKFIVKSDDDLFQEAFDKVMASVEIDNDAKRSFFIEFKAALEVGDPRAEQAAAIKCFYNSDWKWNEFKRWKTVFDLRQKWPYSWESYGVIDDTKPLPNCVLDALEYFTVPEMKAILKNQGIRPRPAPKNRKEVENCFSENISYESIQRVVSEKHGKYVQSCQRNQREGVCRLLSDTIIRTFYALRRYQQIQDLLNDPLIPQVNEYEVIAKCDDADVIGMEFCRMFNSGQLEATPPFFPGDRNALFCVRNRK